MKGRMMALSTKTFKAPSRDELLAKKERLEVELATVAADEQLTRRRDLVEQLAACSLPDATAEQRRLAGAVVAAQAALEEAKKQVRVHDGLRSFKAVELQERRKQVLAELVQTANPRIAAAVAELESEIKQHESQPQFGVACAKSREALVELERLKVLALDDREVAAAIAKIRKPISFT